MIESPVRRRRLLLGGPIALAFLAGGVVGTLVTSAAASRAAQVTLGGARRWFVYDQTQRLALAWNAGDLNKALMHATCGYEAEFGEGAAWFDPKTIGWSIWGGAFAQKTIVEPNAASMTRARPTEEGIALAKIAVVLERLGRGDEAQARLGQAAAAGGEKVEWRELGLRTVGITLPQGYMHPDGTVRP